MKTLIDPMASSHPQQEGSFLFGRTKGNPNGEIPQLCEVALGRNDLFPWQCTRCMSFFKGLIYALFWGGVAWGGIIFVVYCMLK